MNAPIYFTLITAAILLATSIANATPQAEEQTSVSLPTMGANLNQTSVSGLSSGAFMTSQLYIAHSDIMVGAGIIAGGPYLCADSWTFQIPLVTATTTCMNPLTSSVAPNTPKLVEQTKTLSEDGKINPIGNITTDKIYLFSGKADSTVTTMVVDQTAAYFRQLGVPTTSIAYNTRVDAGHAIITNKDSDTACSETQSPYINNCEFEQSHRILNHIYSGLNIPATAATLSGKIVRFDQKEFIDASGFKSTSMSDDAFVYLPESCQTQACDIHVVFHGCQQGYESIGNQYYEGTGYNLIADTNNIIVLYPQVSKSSFSPYNPKGCWDFWGYSSTNSFSPDFYTQAAPQINIVKAMIDRLTKEKS